MESLKGHFLVASGHLADPNFVRTVVLLVDHSDEGAFGVVLNRPSESTIHELWEKVTDSTCENLRPVYMGGPVSGPLMALHAQPALSEFEVVPGVYFSAQRDHLERLVREDQDPLRLFVGHSGWGSGQLEDELRQGAWLSAPATAELVFSSDSEMWKQITHRVGESLLSGMLGIPEFPADPSMN